MTKFISSVIIALLLSATVNAQEASKQEVDALASQIAQVVAQNKQLQDQIAQLRQVMALEQNKKTGKELVQQMRDACKKEGASYKGFINQPQPIPICK